MDATNLLSLVVDAGRGGEPKQVGLAPAVAAASTPEKLRPATGWRRLLHNQRGQGLIEMGMIASIFVLLSMGIIEFGRAFMIANVVTHAARDGARAASVIGSQSRNDDGLFTLGDAPVPVDLSINGLIGSGVVNQIQAFADVSVSDFTQFEITQTPDPPLTAGQIPVVTLTMTVHMPYMFNLVGSAFDVQRSVTFRDEGRNAP